MFKISIIYLYVLKIKIYLFKSLKFSNEWKCNSMRKAYQEKQEGIRNQGWRMEEGNGEGANIHGKHSKRKEKQEIISQ